MSQEFCASPPEQACSPVECAVNSTLNYCCGLDKTTGCFTTCCKVSTSSSSIGIAVGVVAGVIVVALLLAWYYRRSGKLKTCRCVRTDERNMNRHPDVDLAILFHIQNQDQEDEHQATSGGLPTYHALLEEYLQRDFSPELAFQESPPPYQQHPSPNLERHRQVLWNRNFSFYAHPPPPYPDDSDESENLEAHRPCAEYPLFISDSPGLRLTNSNHSGDDDDDDEEEEREKGTSPQPRLSSNSNLSRNTSSSPLIEEPNPESFVQERLHQIILPALQNLSENDSQTLSRAVNLSSTTTRETINNPVSCPTSLKTFV